GPGSPAPSRRSRAACHPPARAYERPPRAAKGARPRRPVWCHMTADLGAATAALEAYLATRLGAVAVHSIAVRAAGRINKGYIARGLELFDVTVEHADGTSHTLQVVRKHTGANEVLALRALRHVPEPSGLPVLIADGRDAAGHWVLLPFYAGSNPLTRLAAPAAVFDV